MSTYKFDHDELDKKIVRVLIENATLTNLLIGKKVGLSASAVNERIRKLKKEGLIKRISAFVDSQFMEMSLCAFIYVLIDKTSHNAAFLKEVKEHDSILECHHMTGEYSYLLKVRVKDTNALEYFITDFLKNLPGVNKTTTQVVLSSPKESSTIID